MNLGVVNNVQKPWPSSLLNYYVQTLKELGYQVKKK
jgi:hypothetical protein